MINFYYKIVASFLLGALISYVYSDFKRIDGVKSLVIDHKHSDIVKISMKMEFIKLVQQKNLNEYYRVTCQTLKSNYRNINDKPFEFEYNDWEIKTINEINQFIQELESQGLCSQSDQHLTRR